MRSQLNQLKSDNDRAKQELEVAKSREKEAAEVLDNITSSKAFKLWSAFGLFKKAVIKSVSKPSLILKGLKVLFTEGPANLVDRIRDHGSGGVSINRQYKAWLKRHYPSSEQLESQAAESRQFKVRPKISILMPTYNTNITHLKEAIESVRTQSYDNWELCIADDASTNPEVVKTIRPFVAQDKRIKLSVRKQNGHISQASNSALEMASGDYIGLLDHDDLLWPNALYECVKIIQLNPKAGLIYTDEDKLSADGKKHIDPFFKPDWSPDYLRSINYITHFTILSRPVFDKIGGFLTKYDGAQDWNLFLRATNYLATRSPIQIFHVPTILYSWRQSKDSTASEAAMRGAKKYVVEAQRRALTDDLKDRGYEGAVEQNRHWTWRVRYQIIGQPKVSIIIPTKDQAKLLERCLDSITEKSTYDNYEIVLVDTGSQEAKTVALYSQLKTNPRIKIINWKKPFNYAAVNNFATRSAVGDYYLFLNNDTKVISPDWIESLLEFAQRPDVGAVGAKLLYPDNTIQHAGVIMGLGGYAGHAHQLLPADAFGYYHRLSVPQDLSAVTAACVMISRQVFDAAKGFDESFALAYNDVDLCLKIRQLGKLVVYTPYAKLYHYESKTRGYEDTPEKLARFGLEKKRLLAKWGELIKQGDPYYNPNLTLLRDDFSLKEKS